MNRDLSEDDSKDLVVSANALSLDASNQLEKSYPAPETDLISAKNLALMPADTFAAKTHEDLENFRAAVLVSEGSALGKRILPSENPKEMIARWELSNLDLKTIVKDALLSGRLPLAVLKLHLQHSKDLVPGTETHDTFNEVRVAGRAIAYDLFLKVG